MKLICLFLAAVLGAGQVNETFTIQLLEGENVWGGRIADGKAMPYPDGFSTTMNTNKGNQVQPLLLTDAGRYVWCEEPFDFKIENGKIELSKLTAEVETAVVGKSLADAYRYAMGKFFAPEGNLPPDEFYEKPQYNTWIELQYNQNQADVLKYAHDILDHGLPPGIIMIDDTWMEDYGKWEFHPGRFPNPKAMCDELHSMGFKIMLWIVPLVSMDQYQIFNNLRWKKGFIEIAEGKPYPVEWWNGFSAELDLTSEVACNWFDGELQRLISEYGVDGFKFDGGDFSHFPKDAINVKGEPNFELCRRYAEFGTKYPYNEFRACWKMGGKPLIQRLHDKDHNWPSLQALIPEMTACGLLGYWYCCPDMVGGGNFTSFLPGCSIDQDLIVRSAQTHALMPMMQFSVAPWRILDEEHLNAVLGAAAIREKLLPTIVDLIHNAAKTGEPVACPMEYAFPGEGFAKLQDQFTLGSDIIVAPMVYPGTVRTVALPKGRWKADDGTIYKGGKTVTIEVPLERIPYFTKIK